MNLGSYSSVRASACLKSGQRRVVRGRKNESQDRAFRHRGIVSRQKGFMADGLENVGARLDQHLLSFELERGRLNTCMRTLTFVQALFSGRMLSMSCELGGCHA